MGALIYVRIFIRGHFGRWRRAKEKSDSIHQRETDRERDQSKSRERKEEQDCLCK